MLSFRITSQSGVPPYMQIIQQVRRALQIGIISPGDRLPTIKEVVSTVPINPNTVFKAYRELERDGLVQSRTGVGTFATKRPHGPPPSAQTVLADDLANWVVRARTVGLDNTSIEALLHITLSEGEEL